MRNDDPFSGINIFVVCADHASFTAAGRVLGLTPSAVSKAMTRLEQELGVKLFQRSPRAVTLTVEGAEFYARCKVLVDGAQLARGQVAEASAAPRGQLRVMVPVSFGMFVVAKALPAWQAQYPQLRVELILSDRIPDMVEERIDVWVRLGPPPDSRLVARALYSAPFVTAAAPSYLALHGTPQTPDDLAGHNCLAYQMAATGNVRSWTFERQGQASEHLPQGNLVCGHATVLLDAALAGQGVVQLPGFVCRQALDEGRLLPLLADYRSFGPPLYVLVTSGRQGLRKISSFIGFLQTLIPADAAYPQ